MIRVFHDTGNMQCPTSCVTTVSLSSPRCYWIVNFLLSSNIKIDNGHFNYYFSACLMSVKHTTKYFFVMAEKREEQKRKQHECLCRCWFSLKNSTTFYGEHSDVL